METDADRDAPNELGSDVLIVGGGPVGLSLATALDDLGCTCIVVESGRHAPDGKLDTLNEGDPSGSGHEDLTLTRRRGVGGTAQAWNTAHGGRMVAKLVGLDPIDLEPRPWVPCSGWPIGYDALSKYYQPAADLLVGAPANLLGEPAPRFGLANTPDLVERRYLFANPDPVTKTLPARIRESANAHLLLGATVTHLIPGPSGDSVHGIQWRTLQGRSGVIRADIVVLAAGGIENPRLLLGAETLPAEIRSQGGWLGRGFMEHPVDASLSIQLTGAQADSASPYELPSGHVVMPRIGLSEQVQRERRLLNASIRLIPSRPDRRTRWLGRLAGLWRRGASSTLARATRVLIDLEQAPHRDNRISLSEQSDPLGCRRVILNWRWRPVDEQRRRGIVDAVTRALEQAGLGPVGEDIDSPFTTSSHHHPGATRMSSDPGSGVVDENLRVHQMRNLYAVGSSVFPTAGFANPTLTSVALALRLAEFLSRVTGGRV